MSADAAVFAFTEEAAGRLGGNRSAAEFLARANPAAEQDGRMYRVRVGKAAREGLFRSERVQKTRVDCSSAGVFARLCSGLQ